MGTSPPGVTPRLFDQRRFAQLRIDLLRQCARGGATSLESLLLVVAIDDRGLVCVCCDLPALAFALGVERGAAPELLGPLGDSRPRFLRRQDLLAVWLAHEA